MGQNLRNGDLLLVGGRVDEGAQLVPQAELAAFHGPQSQHPHRQRLGNGGQIETGLLVAKPCVLLNGKPAVGPAEQHLLPAAHQHAGGGKDLLFQRFLDHLIGLRKVRRSLHGGSSFECFCREIGYSFSGGAQWTISAFLRPSSALRRLGLGFTPTCLMHSSSIFRSLALSP